MQLDELVPTLMAASVSFLVWSNEGSDQGVGAVQNASRSSASASGRTRQQMGNATETSAGSFSRPRGIREGPSVSLNQEKIPRFPGDMGAVGSALQACSSALR